MSEQEQASKLWGGRFQEATDRFVQRFTASVDFDQRMAREDIRGSLAHAQMLRDVGVLNADELAQIQEGMAQVEREIADGSFRTIAGYPSEPEVRALRALTDPDPLAAEAEPYKRVLIVAPRCPACGHEEHFDRRAVIEV